MAIEAREVRKRTCAEGGGIGRCTNDRDAAWMNQSRKRGVSIDSAHGSGVARENRVEGDHPLVTIANEQGIDLE